MAYQIRKLSPEDQAKTGKKFEVVELGYKPLRYDLWNTHQEAEASIKAWEARDELSDKIEDFVDNMLDEYRNRLDEKEIREMIKAA